MTDVAPNHDDNRVIWEAERPSNVIAVDQMKPGHCLAKGRQKETRGEGNRGRETKNKREHTMTSLFIWNVSVCVIISAFHSSLM